MTDNVGRLLLVATPIGNLGDMSPRAVEALRTADMVVAEDTRHSRKLFAHFEIPVAGRLVAGHEHNEAERAASVVAAIQNGRVVALITDAGMPAVSDPGTRIVAACAAADCIVEVIPGPSAVLAGLVVSGLPTERFVFEGFLPRKGPERKARLAAIATEPRTVVLFESPHRVRSLFADLCGVCGDDRAVSIARELTKLHETVWRGTAGAATAFLAETEPRGEYVVVIGPAPVEVRDVSDAEIEAALVERFAAGDTARDAASEVAAALGLPRRRVYDLAVTTQKNARTS
jgi:16S rRNA (cytidine1402-2'-O)-methyltransferase